MTQERLKSLFKYENGLFISISNELYGKPPGTVLRGSWTNRGYVSLRVDGKNVKYHRAVFLFFHGYLPPSVDHKNRDRADNRIDNLRAATLSQNKANTAKYAGCRVPLKGVHFNKRSKLYMSSIRKDKKLIHLGYFKNPKDAAVAYDKKAKELFGEFACPNFP